MSKITHTKENKELRLRKHFRKHPFDINAARILNPILGARVADFIFSPSYHKGEARHRARKERRATQGIFLASVSEVQHVSASD